MRQLWQLLLGKTARNSFITVGANLVYGLIIMAFFALASRALGPEQFGLVSIVLAVYAISFDILSLGTSQALVRFVSLYLGKNKLESALRFAKAIFNLRVIQVVLLLLFAQTIGRFLAINIYQQQSLVLPLSLAVAASGGILLTDFFILLLQSYEKFFRSAITLIAVAALKLVILLSLLLTSTVSIISVTAAFVVTPALAAGLGAILSPREFLKVNGVRQVTKELFNFSKWMAVWGVTASLAGRVDILLLGKLASAYETGIYAVASRLNMGYIIIGSSFASVLVPKISRMVSKPKQLKHQFVLVSKVVVLLTLGIVAIAFFSRWLIPALFGQQYFPSILVFQSLSLSAIFFVASLPANTTLLSLGFSRFIGSLSVLQLAIVLAVGFRLIPLFGAQGAAAALIASYATAFLLSTGYALRQVFRSK